jgi:hypothetical protein
MEKSIPDLRSILIFLDISRKWVEMLSMQFNWLKGGGLWAIATALMTVPVMAQTANFGTFTLGAERTAVVVSGTTGGSTSLPAIVSNNDRNRNQCLGFGDPKPDHVMVLQKSFSRLKLKVNNGNTDNTLVVVGPGNVVRCGDAILEDQDWQAGPYQIWVGSAEAGSRKDYRLSIQGQ